MIDGTSGPLPAPPPPKPAGALLVNIADRSDLSKGGPNGRAIPGVGEQVPVLTEAKGTTRFLGDADSGPWVYYSERPAGDRVPLHRHSANRIEFLIRGAIEWHEQGHEPVRYGAGTMSYVQAGTVYGYDVLEDAAILITFEGPPGVNFL